MRETESRENGERGTSLGDSKVAVGGTSLVGETSLGDNKVTVVVNEKSPHRLRNLNMQFPVGGAVWGRLWNF